MIWPSTSKRILGEEMMDDFSLQGPLLADALVKIARMNTLLGGNRVTIDGIRQLITKDQSAGKVYRIADLGCGNGEMLRLLARFAAKKDLKFELTGIDANKYTVDVAKKLSDNYTSISYVCSNILIEDPRPGEWQYDIILCTLTLHHFTDEQLEILLRRFQKMAAIGIVINDLNRSAFAYVLFKLICFVFKLNYMSREDGLISILRGFKKNELITYSKHLNLQRYSIHWKWAFRYQWIISTQ